MMLAVGLELWDRFTHLDYPEFKQHQRITFFDIFMVNYWRIRNGYHALVVNMIPTLFTITLLICFLFYLHPFIALIFIAFYVVLIFSQLSIHHQLSKSTKQFHTTWREQSYNVGRWVDQFELGKLGRGKKTSHNEFIIGSEHFLNMGDQVNIKKAKWIGIQTLIVQVSRVGTLFLGYFLYVENIIALPAIFSAVIVLGWLQGQLTKAQSAIPILIDAANSQTINNDFLCWDSTESSNNQEAEITIDEPIKEIELQNISFQYDSGKKILQELSLKLERGKVYLIKGNNGSGKTTMAKILLGLLTDYQGRIKINKQTVGNNFSDGLKYRMSYLHQDFSLFYGSLKENYSFGLNETSSDYSEMTRALLPNIMDENMQIGEKGEKLSGGEKQRLALIREWGKNSDLYILDEPLNHLDKDSSEWLKTSIIQKKTTAIIVIVSHQSGFESLADEVKYLENGRLCD